MRTPIRILLAATVPVLLFPASLRAQSLANNDSLLEKAGKFYEDGDWIHAAQWYREAARKGVQPAISWFNHGNCQAQLKKYGEAAASWNRALEWAPRFRRARLNLAILSDESRDWAEAVRQYRRVWELDSTDLLPAIRLGEISLESRSMGEAAQWFTRALDQDSTSRPAMNGLFRTLLQAGDTSAALSRLDRFRPDPLDTTGIPWMETGSLFEAAQAWGKALRSYEEALAANPHLVEAWLRLARLQQRRNRDIEAVVTLRLAVSRLPREPRLWAALGHASLRAGDPATTWMALDSATRLGSSQTRELYQLLSRWHRARGEDTQADQARDKAQAP